MKSPQYFIVKPYDNKAYNDAKKIGDSEIIMSSSIEDHLYVNRYALVECVPSWYNGDMKKGDIAIVHHNVFRVYYDMQGNKKNSWNHFKDNIYLLDQSQIYMYKDPKEDKWHADFPYCFVSPVERMDDKTIITTDAYEANRGVIEVIHNHDSLNVGDVIYFAKEMEYEFEIDGKKMYRMRSIDLCLKV